MFHFVSYFIIQRNPPDLSSHLLIALIVRLKWDVCVKETGYCFTVTSVVWSTANGLLLDSLD